jgi:hypothetical protein
MHGAEEEATAREVIAKRAEFLLGEKISNDDACALRLPVEGNQILSLVQVKRAARLYRRLHRAFVHTRKMSFRDAQHIRDMVSEYEILLATHAKKHSAVSAMMLKLHAVIANPLFLLHVLRQRRRQ